jgi:hypothetical protein
MRKTLRQIERELKTAKHCAIYEEELSRVWPDDGNQREPKLARFGEEHGFACGFIATVCAPFSIKSLPSAAKSNLSACVQRQRFRANNPQLDADVLLHGTVLMHHLHSAPC